MAAAEDYLRNRIRAYDGNCCGGDPCSDVGDGMLVAHDWGVIR